MLLFAKLFLIAYGIRLFKSNECHVFTCTKTGREERKKLNYKNVDYFFVNYVFVAALKGLE